jgi:plasmid replication initiation protein
MSNAQYLEGDGKITCSFNSYITPHLIGLRQKFTKYPLQISSSFKSSYTWRMYEILVSWAKDPKVTEGILAGWCTIEVTELRQMLGVPESYPWGMFDKQIIQTAKTELLEKANIEIEIERTKSGRKITHLKFIFAEIR